jgi:acetoin utilization deacetylase AcuC-like enzyme
MTIKARVTKIWTEIVEESVGSFQDGITIGTHGADVHRYDLVNIAVRVSSEHFSEVAEAMMTANPEEAIKAFTSTLQKGVAKQREFKPLRHKSGLPSEEEMTVLFERHLD